MDKQLTSLAREYGEYVANSLEYDMYPDPGLRYRLVAKGHSEAAQLVLEWLSTRFCLVEKEDIKKYFQSRNYILTNQDEYAVYIVREAEVDMRLLRCLFPEIAKEAKS